MNEWTIFLSGEGNGHLRRAYIVPWTGHNFTSQLHYKFSICYQNHFTVWAKRGMSKLLKVIEPRDRILIHKYQFEVICWSTPSTIIWSDCQSRTSQGSKRRHKRAGRLLISGQKRDSNLKSQYLLVLESDCFVTPEKYKSYKIATLNYNHVCIESKNKQRLECISFHKKVRWKHGLSCDKVDHFPLISSSQCYARSDQEDFSLPRVCSGLAYSLRRKKSEKGTVVSLQAPKWDKIPAAKRSRPLGPIPPPRHCLGFSLFRPNSFIWPGQLFPTTTHHHAQRDPALCSSPRSGNAPFATPVKARQTSGSEVGMGTAPSGALSSQPLPPYLLPTSGLLPGQNMAFLVLRPLPAITCQSDSLWG